MMRKRSFEQRKMSLERQTSTIKKELARLTDQQQVAWQLCV